MDDFVEKLKQIEAIGDPELAAYVAHGRGDRPPPARVVANSEAIWQEYLRLVDSLVAADVGPVGLSALLMFAAKVSESPYLTAEVRGRFTEAIAAMNETMGGTPA